MRYSALITLNFARGNERPGCSLQFWNFIRYCPSGRARGSFCGWVFCVWVSFQSGYHAGWDSAICFCPYLEKNADHTDAPNGAATSRSRSRWSRAAAAATLWSLRENTPQSNSKAAAGAGPSNARTATSCPVCVVCVFFQMTPEIIASPSFECVQKNPENKKGLVRVSSN